MFGLFAVVSSANFSSILDQAVHTEVTAHWRKVSSLDQALFFLKDRHQELIPNLIKTMSEISEPDSTDFIKGIKKLLTANEFNSVRAYIELGYYQPRGAAYQQMVETFAINDKLFIVGSAPTFEYKCTYKQTDSYVYDYDIRFGDQNTIVFADLSDKASLQFVNSLIQSEASFVLRPFNSTGIKETKLRGFGLELHTKNYNLMSFTELGGLNISRVEGFDRHFASYMLSQNRPLPQATRDVVNNWPFIINQMLAMNTTEEGDTSLYAVHSVVPEARTSSSLNGRLLPLDGLDAFQLLSIINEETHVTETLSKLGFNATTAEFLTSVTIDEKGSFLLDFRNEFVKYLNDIETDRESSSWSTSAEELLQPKSGVPRVRKNLLTMIVYADPTSYYGMTQLYTAATLSGTGVPMRIGIVPSFRTSSAIGRRVGFAFHHLAQKSERVAVTFLLEAFKRTGINMTTQRLNPITEGVYASAYKQAARGIGALPWNMLHTVYHMGTPEYEDLRRTQEYFVDANIPHGFITLNGKPIQNMYAGLDQYVSQVREMIVTLSTLVLQNGIDDLADIDIVDLLSQKFPVIQRLDQKIFESKTVSLGIVDDTSKHDEFIEFMRQTDFTRLGNESSYAIVIGANSTEEFLKATAGKMAIAVDPPLPAFIKERIEKIPKPIVITNGRILYGLDLSSPITCDNIVVWSDYFTSHYQSHIDNDKDRLVKMSFVTACACDWASRSIIRLSLPDLFYSGASNLMHVDQNEGAMTWRVVADPLSESYQRCADLIAFASSTKLLNVMMVVSPPAHPHPNAQKTVATFYRSSLTRDTASIPALGFRALTGSSVFPSAWHTSIKASNCDLGALVINNTKYVNYTLDGLLAKGFVRDSTGRAADGLELSLFGGNSLVRNSTVMMNGYYDFVASPGEYELRIEEPVSKDTYKMNRSVFSIATYARSLHDFAAEPKKPGIYMKDAAFRSRKQPKRGETVNVLTFAEGFRHEVFARAFILSAVKHCSAPLRFFIPGEGVSSDFRDSVERMSKDNNFEVNFIEFHWPETMRRPEQTSRRISAQKAILLDRILPSDVHRVIVADSDLEIEGDLSEIFSMRMGNASIAMPPFCTSPDPQAYWKVSSWRRFLRSSGFYAPSLMVVDLDQYRSKNVGDLLRMQFDSLGPQLERPAYDLTNMAADHIGVTDIPHSWMWCSRYCAAEEEETALARGICGNLENERSATDRHRELIAEAAKYDVSREK